MIKTLQNTLKQDKEGFVLPKSVQDAIPIRRLWPDGIFQFGSKFSKTIRFSDINYAIASKEDKTSMFLGYSELLNALDTGSTTKITINNKRLNRQNFEQEILLPRHDDYLDGYRAEYNAMLMDKVTDSSNSVVQERYVTLSVHRKNIEEARAFFDRVTADVTTRLSHMDAHSEELDAVERLRVLHDFYRTGEETDYHLDLRGLMQKGHSFKDSLTARAQRPFKIPGQHIVFASRKYPADLGQDLFPLFPLEGADAVLPQGTRPVLEDELPVIPARKAPFPNTVYAVLQPLVQLRGALLALYGFVILLIEADVPAALTAVELTSGHQAVKIIVVGGTQVLVD